MNKLFDLKEEELQLLQQVKAEKKLKTDVAALRYIFREYQELQNETKRIERAIEAYHYANKEFRERLRWATRVAEQNSIMLLDAVNTILTREKIMDCVPVDIYESPVIGESRKRIKDKIAHFKQAKDDRKARRK